MKRKNIEKRTAKQVIKGKVQQSIKQNIGQNKIIKLRESKEFKETEEIKVPREKNEKPFMSRWLFNIRWKAKKRR